MNKVRMLTKMRAKRTKTSGEIAAVPVTATTGIRLVRNLAVMLRVELYRIIRQLRFVRLFYFRFVNNE